jgi:hypothetical protein
VGHGKWFSITDIESHCSQWLQTLTLNRQLDNEWPMYHRVKVQRLADRGDKIVQTMPQAHEAAWELCQDMCEFLYRRYPQVYKIQRSKKDNIGWYGLGSVASIEMPSLGASYDLTREDPLTVSGETRRGKGSANIYQVAGLIQPADLNILMMGDDGQYHLVAMMLGIGGKY